MASLLRRVGAEFTANSTTAGHQWFQQMAPLSGGGFVVVWVDELRGGVAAQRFDADGARLGGEIHLSNTAALESVAGLASGGFVATWMGGGNGTTSDIKARIFDQEGLPLGPEFTVNTADAVHQQSSQAIGLPGGGFVVHWHDTGGTSGGDPNVRAQMFDGSGAKLGSEFTVNTTLPGTQRDSTGIALDGGGFVIVWADFPSGGEGDVRGQIFDSSGNRVGGEFMVPTVTAGNQWYPDLAALPGGGFVVAWPGPQFAHAQIFDPAGAKVGSEIRVSDSDNGVISLSVTALPDGAFMIGWHNTAPSPGIPSMRGQLFDPDGNRMGSQFQINEAQITGGTPQLATLSSGRVVASWLTGNYEVQTAIFRAPLIGTPAADVLAGTEADDGIAGLGSDDLLSGAGGDDSLDGGEGNDVLIGGEGADSLDGGGGSDTADYSADSNPLGVIVNLTSNSYLSGFGHPDKYVVGPGQALDGSEDIDQLSGIENVRTGDFADWVAGSDGANRIETGAGNDFIQAGSGDDRLIGGSGVDTMNGGAGNDVYDVDSRSDFITEAVGKGIDTAEIHAASFTLNTNVENAVAMFEGSGPAQTVRGNALNNRLDGSTGNDVLIGRAGDDLLAGGAGIDILTGGAGTDLLIGGSLSAVELIVNGSFETISGSDDARSVVLSGDSGGGGDYRAHVASSLFGWQLGSSDGIELNTGTGAGSFNTAAGEVLVDLEVGYGKNQSLIQDIPGVAAGTQLVLRFAAAASMDGGGQLEVRWNGAVIATITPASYAMTQHSFLVTAVADGSGAGGSNQLEFRETGAHSGRGTLVDAVSLRAIVDEDETDWLSYDSELDGGSLGVLVNLSDGAALLDGILVGAGEARDTNGQLDRIVGFSNVAAADLGYSWILGSEDANFLIGGNGDDVLNGAGGDDMLDGGSGSDGMTGGTGDDVYLVDNAGDVIVENAGGGTDEVRAQVGTHVLAANVENLVATSDINHDFRGNGGDNLIAGGGGSDLLRLYDGGDDTVLAGAGSDNIFFIGSLTAADVVNGGAGVDTLVLQGPYGALTLTSNITQIENVSILAGSNTGFGEPGSNRYDYVLTTHNSNFAAGVQARINGAALLEGEDFTFDGSAETDASYVVYGGKGKDTLLGGLGNDIFFYAEERFASGDTVNGGSGYDGMFLRGNYTIDFNAPGYTGLFTNIENLTLTSATDERYARGGGTEFDYNLTLSDAIVGAGQELTISGALLMASETMVLDASRETNGTVRLFGGRAADTLKGGANADLIHGGFNADTLSGGGGADVFRYQAATDSYAVAKDHIVDFTPGTDKIDLSRIDADEILGGNQAFSWIGSNAFSGTAGELRAFQSGSTWTLEGDVNGDGHADLIVTLTLQGPVPLGSGDFLP